MRTRKATTALALLLAAAGHATAREPAPYRVDVWSSVLFGPDGRAQAVRIVDEDELPEAFVEQVRVRLEAARVEPRQVDGRAVTFRTGVRMVFQVKPGKKDGTVKLLGVEMAPLPTSQSFVAFPADIARSAGYEGAMTVVCHVSVDGRCGSTDIREAGALPPSARRWADASFERWRFEPQEVDGQPVAGEYAIRITMETEWPPREDFRQDRFLRSISR